MEQTDSTRERSHRLPREAYVGKKAVVFTACLRRPQSGLASLDIVRALTPMMARAAERFGCTVPVYTFMPDHLHALMLGLSDVSDGLEAMRRFKAESGWWLYRHDSNLHWEKDFWDHIVSSDEDWRAQALYIAMNPVRKGLVSEMLDWPYTASVGHHLMDVLGEALR